MITVNGTCINDSRKIDDIKLATVDNNALYLSDLKEVLQYDSPEDSARQVNALIEQWLRRTVLIEEAEKNLPKDIDIEHLINDYRNSLILDNYKQVLVSKQLDHYVTSQEIVAYYESHQSLFQLQEPIFQAYLASVSGTSPNIDRFDREWGLNDKDKIVDYLQNYGSRFIVDDTIWYNVGSILKFFPFEISEESLMKKGNIQKSYDGQEYFLKILDVKKTSDPPPLSYVREKIKKIIIHNRKADLIKNIETKLYNDYLKGNKIQVFK